MNCDKPGCSQVPDWICPQHDVKFCNADYKNHYRTCEFKAIVFEDYQHSMMNQIKNLNEKCDQIKAQISTYANEAVSSIRSSLKRTLNRLDHQKETLLKIIRSCKSENETNTILKTLPESISWDKSFERFEDLEEKFDFEALKTIEMKNSAQENSVLQSLENLDDELRKDWLVEQDMAIFLPFWIEKISISKDSKYVFACKYKKSVAIIKVKLGRYLILSELG